MKIKILFQYSWKNLLFKVTAVNLAQLHDYSASIE